MFTKGVTREQRDSMTGGHERDDDVEVVDALRHTRCTARPGRETGKHASHREALPHRDPLLSNDVLRPHLVAPSKWMIERHRDVEGLAEQWHDDQAATRLALPPAGRGGPAIRAMCDDDVHAVGEGDEVVLGDVLVQDFEVDAAEGMDASEQLRQKELSPALECRDAHAATGVLEEGLASGTSLFQGDCDVDGSIGQRISRGSQP